MVLALVLVHVFHLSLPVVLEFPFPESNIVGKETLMSKMTRRAFHPPLWTSS
jgi:hypothetical protein